MRQLKMTTNHLQPISTKKTSNIDDQASTTITLPMKTSVRVKPLTKKQVSNILTAVCGAYPSFSEPQQFDISNLALQLQEVMCLDKSRSDVVVHHNKGMILEVPNADARMNQRKKRAQSIHEIQANVASKKEEFAKHRTVTRCVKRFVLYSSQWTL